MAKIKSWDNFKIDLKIESPKKKSNPFTGWKIVVDFMHGDADADTKETLKFKPEEKDQLEFWIKALEICIRQPSGYRENYYDAIKKEMGEKWADRVSDFIPGDVTMDHQLPASVEGYKVIYVENDISHNVKVDKSW